MRAAAKVSVDMVTRGAGTIRIGIASAAISARALARSSKVRDRTERTAVVRQTATVDTMATVEIGVARVAVVTIGATINGVARIERVCVSARLRRNARVDPIPIRRLPR
jgi:hypothetical protein